jgi:hypothetical protein
LALIARNLTGGTVVGEGVGVGVGVNVGVGKTGMVADGVTGMADGVTVTTAVGEMGDAIGDNETIEEGVFVMPTPPPLQAVLH